MTIQAEHISTNRVILFLLLIITFHAIGNFLWLSKGSISGGCDVVNHLSEQRKFYNEATTILREGKWSGLTGLLWNSNCHNWPKSTYVFTCLVQTAFPKSHFAGIWATGIFFLALCIIGTFLTARQMFGSHVAVFSAVLVSLYPGIYGLSRKYGLDLPLASVISFCFWSMARFMDSQNWKNALLLGVLCGLGVLIKPQAIFFVFVPAALAIIKFSTKCKFRSKIFIIRIAPDNKAWIHSAILISSVLVVSSIWWSGHLGEIYENFVHHLSASSDQLPTDANTSSPVLTKLFYIISLPTHMSVIGTALFIISVPFFSWRLSKTALIFVLPPLLVFTCFFENKWARFLFPVYPMLAILVTATIFRIKRTFLRQVILLTMLFSMLCNYVSSSFWHIPPLQWLHDRVMIQSIGGDYAHISFESNYIEVVSDIANIIRTDFKGSEIPKIGIVESPLLWGCDGFPLLDYLLRLYIPEMESLGDKRDPRQFYSNYQTFDYFIIVEQCTGCGRDSLACFNTPDEWVSLGDPTFDKTAPEKEVIKYLSESETLASFDLLPENVMIYLIKVGKTGLMPG